MSDTIYALASGAPPAAIGVIRISGPLASDALLYFTTRLPVPRQLSRRCLRAANSELLDDVLVAWFPAPGSATGEDVVELHCHGGRAVIAAIEIALSGIPGLRRAQPGEFTRRAFVNGKLDLAEAEGLADLLTAETDLQRRAALAMAGGAFSRQVEAWREALLVASAQIEAVLDFGEEEDVVQLAPDQASLLRDLETELGEWLCRPRAEALREGFRVVIAGPPNAGKSTLFNALVESDAAITAPIAGTTRDVLTRPVALGGFPFTFVDTAGLHERAGDPIEAIGIDRARSETERADLVLWLGEEAAGPEGAWEIEPQCDRPERALKQRPRHRISALTGEGLDDLRVDLIDAACAAMPRPGEAALNQRQHRLLGEARESIEATTRIADPLLIAEHLRLARLAFDALVGRTATEDMLDALFGRFCIGK